MKIRKSMISRIMEEGIVDTEKYRYIAKDCGDHLEIRRIELDKLDTTYAIDGWELVEMIR